MRCFFAYQVEDDGSITTIDPATVKYEHLCVYPPGATPPVKCVDCDRVLLPSGRITP